MQIGIRQLAVGKVLAVARFIYILNRQSLHYFDSTETRPCIIRLLAEKSFTKYSKKTRKNVKYKSADYTDFRRLRLNIELREIG